MATDEQRAQRESLDTDRGLAARLRAGDRTALDEVFERERPRLVALTTRVMGERGLAEDVVQDVFATLWHRPHIYEPERGGLRHWLGMRCRGVAVDRVRSRVARDRREAFVLRGESGAHHDEYDADDGHDIEQALAALQPDHRRLIQLTYFGGLSYCAAATLLDIPEGTAKSRMRQALKVLRHQLSAPQPAEPDSFWVAPRSATTAA